MSKIVAFDPGVTTGVCVLQTTLDDTDFAVKYVGEIPWERRFSQTKAFITGTLPLPKGRLHPPEFVVVERFRLRQRSAMSQSGSEFPSSQVSAIIESMVWVYLKKVPDTFVYYQEPLIMSRTKILERDEALVVGSEHMKDAYKHARFFFVTNVRRSK